MGIRNFLRNLLRENFYKNTHEDGDEDEELMVVENSFAGVPGDFFENLPQTTTFSFQFAECEDTEYKVFWEGR
ncbi:hypothetical protein [Caldisericum sp.]|uniref:hypothetical protein n=1 Tax=Caldisericum sp. TaxID=2499687 RepID=UPI003D0AEFF3